MKTKKEFLSESSLSRVQRQWSEHDTGTITAFRDNKDCGTGEKYTTKSKKARNAVLKAKLLKRGFGVTKVQGSWYESGDKLVNEESFFVTDLKNTGKLKKELIVLGIEFEQDAITYADKGGDYYAISTNECGDAWPGFGKLRKSAKLGKPVFGKSGLDGFSKVNGRAFVFKESTILTKLDHSPTHIRSIQHIDEVDISDL